MKLKNKTILGILGLTTLLGCEISQSNDEETYREQTDAVKFFLGYGIAERGYETGNPAAANVGNAMVGSALQQPNQTNVYVNTNNSERSKSAAEKAIEGYDLNAHYHWSEYMKKRERVQDYSMTDEMKANNKFYAFNKTADLNSLFIIKISKLL